MRKAKLVLVGVAAAAAVQGASGHEGGAHAGARHGGERAIATAAKEQTRWGIAGEARDVTRTVEVRMADTMRFVPAHITVRTGDTVRFVVRNHGKLMHELVIGTRPVLAEHAAAMRKFPGMAHDEPHMVHVAPGRRGEIVWKFNRAGEFDFACLIAGHYESGMTGRIDVTPR